jgi:hypothetical protein
MNEDQEPYHPQETANSKDICRRPGCGTVEVPMSVDSSRCCFPPRHELLLQVGKDVGLLLSPALQALLPTAG